MPYDSPYSPRRPGPRHYARQSAWRELHDYDYEMRRPYRPGALVEAFEDWRRFRQDEVRYGLRRSDESIGPADAAEELRLWKMWRRARAHGEPNPLEAEARRRRRPPVGAPPSRGRARRQPRWPRIGL